MVRTCTGGRPAIGTAEAVCAGQTRQERSSSFAKNTLAALRTSFALRSSAFSRRRRLFSSATSGGHTGTLPAVDFATAMPHPQRLRAHTKKPSDMTHRGHEIRMRGLRLVQHPQRLLPHLGRVLLIHQFHPCLKNGTERNPERFTLPGQRRTLDVYTLICEEPVMPLTSASRPRRGRRRDTVLKRCFSTRRPLLAFRTRPLCRRCHRLPARDR